MINKGDYDYLVGKWAIDYTYEDKDKELPLWADGDVWMTRQFICGVSYWNVSNHFERDPLPTDLGELTASVGVIHGHFIKKIMERHGGTLNIARLRSEPGSINDVVVIDNKICNAFVLRERPEDDLIIRLEIIEEAPAWFKWIMGQQSMF